jgi:signal peptidase I
MRDEAWRHRATEGRKNMPLWQELPLLLIVAFCLAVLIRTFLFQAFFIPSGSMQNTLEIGDRVLVNKVVYDTRQPARGDIVVFRGTDNWASEVPQDQTNPNFLAKLGRTLGDLVGISEPGEKDFIKRVIGLPGDTIEGRDGQILIDGRALKEPYTAKNSPMSDFPARKVPPGHFFVMGDNRGNSKDSRVFGPISKSLIVGRAFIRVWPLSHISLL